MIYPGLSLLAFWKELFLSLYPFFHFLLYFSFPALAGERFRAIRSFLRLALDPYLGDESDVSGQGLSIAEMQSQALALEHDHLYCHVYSPSTPASATFLDQRNLTIVGWMEACTDQGPRPPPILSAGLRLADANWDGDKSP